MSAATAAAAAGTAVPASVPAVVVDAAIAAAIGAEVSSRDMFLVVAVVVTLIAIAPSGFLHVGARVLAAETPDEATRGGGVIGGEGGGHR